jgi:uncharacterized membrane protein YfcA
VLFAAGFSGGFIDSIAGGGGLITVPCLLAVGLPPQIALGTNKVQSSCGTTIAVRHYLRAGWMNTSRIGFAVAASFAFSIFGALAVTLLSKELLRWLIPWLLAGVAVYTALNRRFGLHSGRQRMAPLPFAICFGGILGFYDGFFGPGTGSFWTVALVTLLGLDLREATGYTKAANLASNVGSLAVFLPTGSVHWAAAGAMIAGQLLGARSGSRLALKKGAEFIRPVFLGVVFAMTLKLLWDVLQGR